MCWRITSHIWRSAAATSARLFLFSRQVDGSQHPGRVSLLAEIRPDGRKQASDEIAVTAGLDGSEDLVIRQTDRLEALDVGLAHQPGGNSQLLGEVEDGILLRVQRGLEPIGHDLGHLGPRSVAVCAEKLSVMDRSILARQQRRDLRRN
jgi:hypothetical protein